MRQNNLNGYLSIFFSSKILWLCNLTDTYDATENVITDIKWQWPESTINLIAKEQMCR